MTVATIWVEGAKKEGHGKDMNEAFDDLQKKWHKTCDDNPEKDRKYLLKHASAVKYSSG